MWGLAIDVVDYLLMWGDIDVGGSPGVVGKQTVDVEGPPIDVGGMLFDTVKPAMYKVAPHVDVGKLLVDVGELPIDVGEPPIDVGDQLLMWGDQLLMWETIC